MLAGGAYPLAAADCRDCRVAQQVPQNRFEQAAAYAMATGGVALMILQGDRVVFEQYAPGFDSNTPHILASGTKSFSGVIAAAAVQDGLLDFDERVSDTLTEWKADPLKARMTVRQLLSLESGLGKAGRGGHPVSFAQAVQVPAVAPPATAFDYNPVNFQAFGELMRRKLAPRREQPLAYLQRRVFDPMGLSVSQWRTTDDNDPDLPGGGVMSARDWARFGLFLKNGGSWQGRQIIERKYLQQCFVRSPLNPAYGLSFWLNAPSSTGRSQRSNPVGGVGPLDLFMAAGAGGQRLYVIPSQDMVVVRFATLGAGRGRGGGRMFGQGGAGSGGRFFDSQFIQLLFPGSTG